MTVQELINRALTLIGVIATGHTPAPEESNDGLQVLNQVLASWSADGLACYQIRRDTFTLTGAQSYTMGTGGVFSAQRPTRVVAARASSGNYGRSLRIIDVNRWTEILERGGAVNLPGKAYVDYSNPLATVYLWPAPLVGTVIELYTLQEFTTFLEGVAAPPPAPPAPVHNFKPERMTYTLPAAASSFTIGPGGLLSQPRPARCDAIAASGGGYRRMVEIVSAAEWSTLLEPSGSPISVPMELYVEYGYPLATLYVWPVTSGSIEVHSLQQFTAFASLAATVDMPPGYERALRYALAIDLAPEYGRPVDPAVAGIANESKNAISRLNALTMGMTPPGDATSAQAGPRAPAAA
jgi:hypothetical protein